MFEKSQHTFLTWVTDETPKFLALLLRHIGLHRILIKKWILFFDALLDSKAIKHIFLELSFFRSRLNIMQKIIQFLKRSKTVLICNFDMELSITSTEAEHLYLSCLLLTLFNGVVYRERLA